MTTGATVEDHLRHNLDASAVESRVEQRHKQPFSLAPPELPVSLVLVFGPREETRQQDTEPMQTPGVKTQSHTYY